MLNAGSGSGILRLAPETTFALRAAPFGLAWYQGDIETNKDGVGYGQFIGRFSIETFIVAPGVANAPADPFHDPKRIPDALPIFTNPQPQSQQLH